MGTMSETLNGKVFRCPKCNRVHFEYKNLNLNFTEKEYCFFVNHVKQIKAEDYYSKANKIPFKRKIYIPIGNRSINFLLNERELLEIKGLLIASEKPDFKLIDEFKFFVCKN